VPATALFILIGAEPHTGLLLLAAWAADRRGKRRGHHLKAGADIYRDVREQNRDNRAGDEQAYLNQDQSWSHRSRQARDRHTP
jgi:hypothetical protein